MTEQHEDSEKQNTKQIGKKKKKKQIVTQLLSEILNAKNHQLEKKYSKCYICKQLSSNGII